VSVVVLREVQTPGPVQNSGVGIEGAFASDIKGNVETGTAPDRMMEIVFLGLQENCCAICKLTSSSMKGSVYKHIFFCIFVITNPGP
jgi:hypothetical protein